LKLLPKKDHPKKKIIRKGKPATVKFSKKLSGAVKFLICGKYIFRENLLQQINFSENFTAADIFFSIRKNIFSYTQ
jgi:hypothetical protein